MLLELFPFVILNNAIAFVYAYFFSDCYPAGGGGSNKHCLLSLFSLLLTSLLIAIETIDKLDESLKFQT